MSILIVESNPQWLKEFNAEKIRLETHLNEIIAHIHHIGSTSILGLAAKPIIDIMIDVHDIDCLDNSLLIFKTLGYEAKGEFGLSGRRYYINHNTKPQFQLHAYQTGDKNIIRHIAFKEYLKFHPNILQQYAELKINIASEFSSNIQQYCVGKEKFINYYEQKALIWMKKIGEFK